MAIGAAWVSAIVAVIRLIADFYEKHRDRAKQLKASASVIASAGDKSQVLKSLGIPESGSGLFDPTTGLLTPPGVVELLNQIGVLQDGERFVDVILLRQELMADGQTEEGGPYDYNFKTYVVFTNRRAILVWDDPEDRAEAEREGRAPEEDLIQWDLPLEKLTAETVRAYKNNDGHFVDFTQKHRKWYYSPRLHGTPDQMKAKILDAVSRARQTP